MLKITNYGAACCVIEGNDLRILCDPWFTDGIYLGAWERENYIADPIKAIGQCDYIWISHLHEDHYDPVFLRQYMAAYPSVRLWAADIKGYYLFKIMRRDGFTPWSGTRIEERGIAAQTFINGGGSEAEHIDSALVVTDADTAIINMNDCPFDQRQINDINAMTEGRHVTALIPYAGAGPWPQCYHMSSTACLAAAGDKKRRFLNQFQHYRAALHANVAVPFSAGYRLRGKLADMNAYRGIAKQDDVQGATLLPVTGVTDRPSTDSSGYVWEDAPLPSNDDLERLIKQAQARAPKVLGDPLAIELSLDGKAVRIDATAEPASAPHETISLDARPLQGLLTRQYHWNTAEISSVLRLDRHGETYDPRVFDYLFHFHT